MSQLQQFRGDGIVTGKAKGTTNIIAKTADGTVQKKCRVNVIQIEEGVYVEFDSSLTIEGDEISNLNLEHLTVKEVLNLINTNMNLEILKYDDTKLGEDEKVGTGSKLIIKNQNDQIIYQYKFILYGDVNGDGNINSLDVLVLQKHILEIKLLEQEFLKAGNISRNGAIPSSLDVLKLQKHILEIKLIEQGDNNYLLSDELQQEDIIQEENEKEEMENEDITEDNNATNEEENGNIVNEVESDIKNEEESNIENEENNYNIIVNEETNNITDEEIVNEEDNIMNVQ